MRQRTYNVVFVAVFLLVLGSVLLARAGDAPVSLMRTVPANAVLNYVVENRVVQSMPLQPGVYRITVERVR